jgi:hypothetical protein
MYDVWVIWEGHGMVRMLLTGRKVCICQYWSYGRGQEEMFLAWVDRQGCRSSKGVDCDILA